MTTTTNCGDSCGLIDFTMAVAGDRLLPEERMELAIKAVTIEKMSQRGAAEKFSVAQQTLSDHLAKATGSGHPAKTQSQPEPSGGQAKAKKGRALTKEVVRSALRKLCKEQGGAPTGFSKSLPLMRGWLKWAGIAIPPELDGKTEPFTPSSTPSSPTPAQPHDTNQQGLHANDSLSVIPDRPTEADSEPEPEHPAFSDHLDIDAVREHVNREVQQSNRPADFKRAIELLTELDRICTDAWYRRHPEPWGHDDWAHVSSEIEALHSIVGQRAEETADELLRKSSAVEVKSTVVC